MRWPVDIRVNPHQKRSVNGVKTYVKIGNGPPGVPLELVTLLQDLLFHQLVEDPFKFSTLELILCEAKGVQCHVEHVILLACQKVATLDVGHLAVGLNCLDGGDSAGCEVLLLDPRFVLAIVARLVAVGGVEVLAKVPQYSDPSTFLELLAELGDPVHQRLLQGFLLAIAGLVAVDHSSQLDRVALTVE